MLLGKRCAEPATSRKAVYNPAATLDKYGGDITDARRHWSRELRRAARADSEALFSIGSAIMQGLTDGTLDWNYAVANPGIPKRKTILERGRRMTLSTLAVSMLLRAEWTDDNDVVPVFVGEDGKLGTVLDMITDMRHWKDYRVHTPIVAATAMPEGADSQWYLDGDLLLRQVRPVEPTDYLMNEFLPGLGIVPDFSQHETIYPYVATR